MVEQDVFQCFKLLGFQQFFNGTRGEFGESIVGWGKDGEGTCALEGFNQSSRFQRSREGRESAVSDRDVHDILGRQDNAVDDMNDAVVGLNIGDDYFRVIDEDLSFLDLDAYLGAQRGFGVFKCHNLFSFDAARDDVVKQDILERFKILGLQKFCDSAFGQFSKSIVGGREDGEGTFALEGINQTRGLHSRYKGGEATISNSGFDDVFRRQNDAVYHMNDTVGCQDVREHDLGAVNFCRAVHQADCGGFALGCGDFVKFYYIRRELTAFGDMVQQDVGQRGNVGEQSFHSALRQLGKSFIGRREDGEGTFALESFYQTSSLQSGRKGGKASVFNSNVNNILWREQDAVNDVDYAVICRDVRDDNLRFIQENLAIGNRDFDGDSVESINRGKSDNIRGQRFAVGDMIKEYVGEGRNICQERFDSSGG